MDYNKKQLKLLYFILGEVIEDCGEQDWYHEKRELEGEKYIPIAVLRQLQIDIAKKI